MWQAYMDFMERNKRRPSKYYSEDKALYNWCKHSRKLMNNGKLPSERVPLFRILMDTAKNYRRLNQYSYASGVNIEGGNAYSAVETNDSQSRMRPTNAGVSLLYNDKVKVVAPTLFPEEE